MEAEHPECVSKLSEGLLCATLCLSVILLIMMLSYTKKTQRGTKETHFPNS